MSKCLSRRQFVVGAAAAGVSLTMVGTAGAADKPALLGGTPVHKGGWPKWPVWRESWEPDILKVLRSGHWCRASKGGEVPVFEAAYAQLLGAKRCLATASGTTALITSLYVTGAPSASRRIATVSRNSKAIGRSAPRESNSTRTCSLPIAARSTILSKPSARSRLTPASWPEAESNAFSKDNRP